MLLQLCMLAHLHPWFDTVPFLTMCRELFANPPRVTVLIGDQGNTTFWKQVAEQHADGFDIILDDGGAASCALATALACACSWCGIECGTLRSSAAASSARPQCSSNVLLLERGCGKCHVHVW
jgi:hypothetical protein